MLYDHPDNFQPEKLTSFQWASTQGFSHLLIINLHIIMCVCGSPYLIFPKSLSFAYHSFTICIFFKNITAANSEGMLCSGK